MQLFFLITLNIRGFDKVFCYSKGWGEGGGSQIMEYEHVQNYNTKVSHEIFHPFKSMI